VIELKVKLNSEDIFNDIIENNPNLSPLERVVIWEKCMEIVDEIDRASERVTCLNV
jgi:hypothetical protein